MHDTGPRTGSAKPTSYDPAHPPEQTVGSITRWIGDLKAGDDQAIQPLWDRYFTTLVERARTKLLAIGSSRAVNDEEDVALSAFQSLHDGVREGRFPRLEDRDDLWRLLLHLSACKAIDGHRAEQRQKRGGGKLIREADMLASGSDEDDAQALDGIIGSEPSPEFAAIVAEEFARRLDNLDDATLRRIAELKLASNTNEEIRQQLGCSLRSVTLKLELIRKLWRDETAQSKR